MNQLFAMVRKEMMTVLRSRKAFWLMLITMVCCGFAFWVSWRSVGAVLDIGIEYRAEAARGFFTGLVVIELIAFSICAPVLAAGTITIERERRTLDLLYCTGLKPLHILMGKWIAVIAFVVLLLIAMLPIESLLFSLGGVDVTEYIRTSLVIATVVLSYGMFGIYISSRARRSATAVVATIGILALYNFGGPALAAVFFSMMAFAGSPPTWLIILAGASPVATLLCVAEDVSRAAMPISLNAILAFFYVFHGALFFLSARGAWRRLQIVESVSVATPPPVPLLIGGVGSKMSLAIPELGKAPPAGRGRASWLFRRFSFLDLVGAGNPVFHREITFGAIGRGRPFGLILTLAILFSLFGLFWREADAVNQAKATTTILLMYILGLLPAWGAIAITSEREEMTWPMLRATPLTERQVLLGKFAAYVKAVLVVGLAISAIPFAGGLLYRIFEFRDVTTLVAAYLTITLPTILAYALFAGAIMMYWSCRSRTNAAAVTSTYVTLFLINVVPLILRGWFGDYVLDCTSNFNWVIPPAGRWHMWLPGIYMHIISPLLSPILFLNEPKDALNIGHWDYASYTPTVETDSYWSIVASCVLLALATHFILRRAERGLRRAEGEGSGE